MIQEAFTEYLINENVISRDLLSQKQYLSDFLLLNILDQIWIQEVYEPHESDLIACFQFELLFSHDIERIEELFSKRVILTKIYKIILATSQN